MKALLDTNFLLIPATFKVDIFFELKRLGVTEFYTLDSVIRELETLCKRSGIVSKQAKLTLKLVGAKEVQVLKSKQKRVDEELLSLRRNYIICTQDTDLIKSLKEEKREIIYLKQKKYLVKLGE